MQSFAMGFFLKKKILTNNRLSISVEQRISLHEKGLLAFEEKNTLVRSNKWIVYQSPKY